MALFEEYEDDDKDVKLDAWMWWLIAFGGLVSIVATLFLVRAVADLRVTRRCGGARKGAVVGVAQLERARDAASARGGARPALLDV